MISYSSMLVDYYAFSSAVIDCWMFYVEVLVIGGLIECVGVAGEC